MDHVGRDSPLTSEAGPLPSIESEDTSIRAETSRARDLMVTRWSGGLLAI